MSTVTGLPGGVNPLDFLHKLAAQRGIPRPVFTQMGEQGPPHMKTFVWHCSFNEVIATGTGRSKKEAKVAAARAVREQLDFSTLPEIPAPNPAASRKRKNNGGENEGQRNVPSGGKKAKNWDGPFHFQCYGMGGPNFGHMVPYGYNATMDPKVDWNSMMEDYGPCIDPSGFDPFTSEAPEKPNIPMFTSRLSKLDRYVIKKHSDVYPPEEKLDKILKMVTDIESVIKDVAEEWKKSDSETDDKGTQLQLDGLVRVGDLAKGLLLATDNNVQVVLLCKKMPTMNDVVQVQKVINPKLKELNDDYEIAFEAAGLRVALKTEAVCHVVFTSTVLRKKPRVEKATSEAVEVKQEAVEVKQEAVDEEEEEAKPEQVPGALPKDKCLQALAEVRHARWFNTMVLAIPSCVECIRIVKDIASRDPSWTMLTGWTIELIVERALFTAFRPLNPAASLMRVMEVISSGLLQSNDVNLLDPCERSPINVVAYLTKQQKEDITRSAQHFLRLMHFRQIYKVLGMSEDEVVDDFKKSADGDNDVKKEQEEEEEEDKNGGSNGNEES